MSYIINTAVLFLYKIINVSFSFQMDILPSTNEDEVYKTLVLNNYDHRPEVIFHWDWELAEMIWRIQDDPIWNAFMTIRTSKHVKFNVTRCLEWDFQTIPITLKATVERLGHTVVIVRLMGHFLHHLWILRASTLYTIANFELQ